MASYPGHPPAIVEHDRKQSQEDYPTYAAYTAGVYKVVFLSFISTIIFSRVVFLRTFIPPLFWHLSQVRIPTWNQVLQKRYFLVYYILCKYLHPFSMPVSRMQSSLHIICEKCWSVVLLVSIPDKNFGPARVLVLPIWKEERLLSFLQAPLQSKTII